MQQILEHNLNFCRVKGIHILINTNSINVLCLEMDLTLAMAKTMHYLAHCWVYVAYTIINEVNDRKFLLLSPHLSLAAS